MSIKRECQRRMRQRAHERQQASHREPIGSDFFNVPHFRTVKPRHIFGSIVYSAKLAGKPVDIYDTCCTCANEARDGMKPWRAVEVLFRGKVLAVCDTCFSIRSEPGRKESGESGYWLEGVA